MIQVARIAPEDWSRLYSELAHMAVFGKSKPANFDRIDFALLASSDEEIMGYVTCREHDHETLYWQFGGAFQGAKTSLRTFRTYEALISACGNGYKRISTLIENTNFPMLRLAMKAGFRIMGVRAYQNSILLEHLLEFDHE